MNQSQTKLNFSSSMRLVFPLVYGQSSKDNEFAIHLYELFRQFIEGKEIKSYISISEKDQKKMMDKLAKTKKSWTQMDTGIYAKFMCQYGCVLIISKQKIESPISVELIVPEEWSSGCNNSQAPKLELCEAKNQFSVYTPQLIQYSQQLKTIAKVIQSKLEQTIAKNRKFSTQKNPESERYTPQEVEKSVKEVLSYSDFNTYNRIFKQQEEKKQKQQRKQKENEKSPTKNFHTISSQAIQFVNSNVDLAWYVTEALIRKLLINTKNSNKSRSKCNQFIVNYKCYLLEKSIKETIQTKTALGRQEISRLKKCLDEVIYFYKHEVSPFIKQDQEFPIKIKSLEDLIVCQNGGRITIRIQDKNIPDEIRLPQCGQAKITKPQAICYKKQTVELMKIQEYTTKINQRVPFESLLQVYQKKTASSKQWDSLSADKKQEFYDHWILLVEKVVFRIGFELGKKDHNENTIIDMLIHMREFECQIGASNACILANLYEEIVSKKEDHYGINLKGQSKSHIQLIKTVLAVVGFQSIKMNRQKKRSNLSQYRVPFDIEKLHKNFTSHNNYARRAMHSMYNYYKKRQALKPLFQLNRSCNSFSEFGKLVGFETRSAHVWIAYVQRILQLQKYKACQNPQYYNNSYSYLKSPLKEYSQNQKWLYAFVHNIPPDILGLIKILAIAQNPMKTQVNMQNNQFTTLNSVNSLITQRLPLQIYNKAAKEDQKFVSKNDTLSQLVGHTEPQNQIKLVFCNSDQAEGLLEKSFRKYYDQQKVELDHKQAQAQKNKKGSSLISYVNPPSDKELKREHKVYADQYLKPKNMEIEQFLSLFTTRAAEQTQIIALCSNILNRRITANCYDKGYQIKQQIFLQCAGQICSYKQQTQKHFGTLKKLVKQYINIWVYSDINFCPIMGPFLSLLIQQLHDMGIAPEQYQEIKKVPFRLAKKCWQQFERGQKEYRQNPEIQIQWDQRFIICAAICCFREVQLETNDREEILLLTKLVLQSRLSKILSDREPRPANKRQFEKERALAMTKAISANIKVISDYLYSNQTELTEIIKFFDQGIPLDTKWQRKSLYQFIGKSSTSTHAYQLDLYRGCIYKNGKQISALDPRIKQNIQFQKIFGLNREFQVFPSNEEGYVRTKDTVNSYFKQNKERLEIYFQFAVDGKKIRYIERKPTKKGQKLQQQKWQLMEASLINQSNVQLPKLYKQAFYAWHCQNKKCIVFRKIKFETIYEIGLVLHLNNTVGKQLLILKAFHVVYHGNYQNQNLQKICDANNKDYQQVILRPKEQKLSQIKAYQYLQKIEPSEHVMQLKNSKSKDDTYFLLYRYQLKFKLSKDTNKLISQNYYGYSVDPTHFDKKEYLYNKFPCLVLRKDDRNLTILNNHKRVMIVSDGTIQLSGKIIKPIKADTHINLFRYDIHDIFGDLRGSTRQSQLYLATLMLSIDDNLRMNQIQMTPLEFAMDLLKTCFTNRPFNEKQCGKFRNLLSFAFDEVLILCEVLWKGSLKLKQILPFTEKVVRQDNMLEQRQKQLLQGRTLYKKKQEHNTISYRQKLTQNFLKFIGIIIVQKSEESSQSDFQQPQFWKNISQYEGANLQNQYDEILRNYREFINETKQIDFLNLKAQQNAKSSSSFAFWNKNIQPPKQKLILPPQIEANCTQNSDKSVMMVQMLAEVKKSYECFIRSQELESAIFRELNEKSYLKIVENLHTKTSELIIKIQLLINQIKRQNERHPDIISGFRPTLSKASYTKILCNKDQIYSYFPKLQKKKADILKDIIKKWMDLQTRRASFVRIHILLKSEKIDIVALLRQTSSPRDEILNHVEWICFQAEMKIQIWASQLETYNNLMKDTKDGPFCQLNMGQGKTQVIIPMMILNSIFKKSLTLPRINLLSSLYEQARQNMFKFLSVTGFKIPGFQIPFNRKVTLNKNNIYAIRDLMNCFSGIAYLLMKRESRLSEILRYNQKALTHPQQQITLVKMPLLNCQILDIFDEIDAMMTPKKSYIFSIGTKVDLPSSTVRLEIIKECLQILLKSTLKQLLHQKVITTDLTEEQAITIVHKGEYPSGLRLIPENLTKDKKRQWKIKMTTIILKDPRRHEYSFVEKLDQKQFKQLVEYCIDPLVNVKVLCAQISKASYNQIYILRGLFAYGILEHCLSKRCGVDYGVPGPEHVKKIAVPYEAADIPSKTSEYQHPEVSAVLSYIAYNSRGLNQKQFTQCLKSLLNLTPTSMDYQYDQWLQILDEKTRKNLHIDQAKKINLKSHQDQLKLYDIFKKNRKTVAFWLNKCIFPIDLIQYKQNICSSSFDLADVKQSVGFSGTMDNHWILPNKIKLKPCETPSIKGTDGKMIYLTINNTTQICAIVENEKPLWQRFIQLALQKKTGCIIDVGAICVGKSLKNEIVPWVANHKLFDKAKYLGISFCDENGQWQVFDIETQHYINRGTTIPDHQTYVIFDQARTRGADLKMDGNVVAAVSLGPDLSKDKFMQAVGRLRKLGRNQSIIIMGTHEVFSSLPKFPKQIQQVDKKLKQTQTKTLIQLILSWTLSNTIRQNEGLLIQYSNLGWKYVYSKIKKLPFKQQLSAELSIKYEGELQTRMVSQIGKAIFSKKDKGQAEHSTGKHLYNLLEKYGKNVPKQAGVLDDVCQRQVQAEKQQEKVQQNQFFALVPISESNSPTQVTSIVSTSYDFNPKFKMSSNFINTTKFEEESSKGIDNELPQAYFVKFSSSNLTMISLREASIFIKENILTLKSKSSEHIELLQNLTIHHKLIKEYKLEGALVEAKFVAGYENYSLDEEKLLLIFLQRSLKVKIKSEEERKKMLSSIVYQILKRRRTFLTKFVGSSLERMITRLANQNI